MRKEARPNKGAAPAPSPGRTHAEAPTHGPAIGEVDPTPTILPDQPRKDSYENTKH